MVSELAQRRVNDFRQRYGEYSEAALHLAYHAALPVALNAELLHLLRVNFFLDPPELLPYTVEFEFLLSPLCREIDEGLYEIEPEIRDELLAGLTQTYNAERTRDIATLLWQYVDHHSPWADRMELERAQQLTALNFLDPEKAQQWLAKVETNMTKGRGAAREWFVAMRQDIENQAQLLQVSSSELMAAPEVRAAVVAFRTDFQAVCEQIDVVGNYIDLHDLLHTLEFQCYSGIVQEARRFPDDQTALDILMDYELTLQQIVTDMREVADRGTLATNETLWIKDLERTTEELHGAIENLDTRQLKRAVWLINRVLAIQPSRINTSLNTAVRALRLPALVKAMTCVRDNLAHGELDPEKTSQIKDGVEALANLERSLTVLVRTHNDWQELDLELRRIEANLEQDIFELEMSWLDLKAMAESLCKSSIDEWALSFKKDIENLDSAIAAQNPAKVKRYFRSYRRRAVDRFYRVTVELKRLCGILRIVGEPLAFVLRMIE
jgi:hypothetical protein